MVCIVILIDYFSETSYNNQLPLLTIQVAKISESAVINYYSNQCHHWYYYKYLLK